MLQVELVSPERILFSGEAQMVIARTTAGDIAFQPGHVPFVGTLQVHPVRIVLADGTEEVAAVHEGFVECAFDRVTILSDVAELASHIDADRARAAQDRLQQESEHLTDLEREAGLRRAHVRLQVAGGH